MASGKLNADICQLIKERIDPTVIMQQFQKQYGSNLIRKLEYLYRLITEALEWHTPLVLFLLNEEAYCHLWTPAYLQLALASAVARDQIQIVRLVLKHKLDIHAELPQFVRRQTGLDNVVKGAILSDNLHILEMLLESWETPFVDEDNMTLLSLAVMHDSSKCLGYVLSRLDTVMCVNTQNRNGYTPLLLAAQFNPSKIPMLLDLGADPTAHLGPAIGSRNALHLLSSNKTASAATYDYVQLAKILLEAGLDIHLGSTGDDVLCILCDRIKLHIPTIDCHPLCASNTDSSLGDNENATYSIKVIGTELTHCVNYIASISTEQSLLKGLRRAVDQIYYILNSCYSKRLDADKFQVHQLCMVPLMRLVVDLVNIINKCIAVTTESREAVDTTVCLFINHFYSSHQCNEMLMLVDDNFGRTYRAAINQALTVIDILSPNYSNCTQAFGVKYVRLLLWDKALYGPFLDVYLSHVTVSLSNEVLQYLIISADSTSLQDVSETELDMIKCYLQCKLARLKTLKSFSKNSIVAHMKLPLRKHVQYLPLPNSLKRYLTSDSD